MSTSAPITLSQLAAYVSDAIAMHFDSASFWVLADVIDHKRDERKGHHYFCLAEKDPATHSVVAKIGTSAWRSSGAGAIAAFEAQTGQAFQSNIHVLVNVSVSFHAAYGLRLVLNDIDPYYTLGRLEQQRRDTLQKLVTLCPDYVQLAGDRYITRNNSLRHAAVIQRVAVITSSAAAGYKDFEDIIRQNRYGYRITLDIWTAAVQGESNAESLCQRLIDIYQSGIAYDAVVIVRGGGSQSDLLLFDQFVLARAVAKFPIPIITGIGHHINQSIVDLMAHTALKTPSIAAEFIIAHNRIFEEGIMDMEQRIVLHAGGHFSRHRALLAEAAGRLTVYPRMMAAACRADLAAAANSVKSGMGRYLASRRRDLAHYASVTTILDPRNILKRGFTVIYRGNRLVTDSSAIGAADEISIRFYDAKIGAIVTSKTTLDGSIADL